MKINKNCDVFLSLVVFQLIQFHDSLRRFQTIDLWIDIQCFSYGHIARTLTRVASKIDRRLFSVDHSPPLESLFFSLFFLFFFIVLVRSSTAFRWSLPSERRAALVRFIITHGILTSPGRHISFLLFLSFRLCAVSSRGLLKAPRQREHLESPELQA